MARKVDDYHKLDTFERKRLPTFIKEVDEDTGIVQHFVAVIGNVDDGGDLIEPGAFSKTIAGRAKKIRVLDQHNTSSVLNVVGKPIELREVGKSELTPEVLEYAPDASGGLLATTQYAIETDNGRDVFKLIKGGFIDESSIGYDALQFKYKDIVVNGEEQRVRVLQEIRLWEYSNVIWGMNPATATVSAKEAELMEDEVEKEQVKRVVPFQEDLPLADRTLPWDADAAERRVRDWAGYDEDDAEALDWGKYRRAFLWYDAGNEDTLQAYKLPYADVIDDELHAMPRGLFAVASVLQGGRGGANIPEDDQEAIRGIVSRWYARMREEFDDDGLVPTWEKQDEPEAEAEDEPDEKAGRVIAARNAARIQQAVSSLVDVLVDAGLMEAITTEDADEKEEETKIESEQQDGAGPDNEPPTPSDKEAEPSPTLTSADMLREIEMEQAEIGYALIH